MKKPEGKFAWTVKVGEKGQFVIIVLGDVKKGIAIPPKNTFSELASKIFSDDLQEGNDCE